MVDTDGDGIPDTPEIVVNGYRGSGLDVISGIGGLAAGWHYGVEAAEGVTLLAETGMIGAEYGALAGPVGVVIGAAVGIAAGYAIHEYGPGIYNKISNQLQ